MEIEINTKEIAENISNSLMYEWDYINKEEKKVEDILFETIEKESNIAVEKIREDILDKIIDILEEKDICILY